MDSNSLDRRNLIDHYKYWRDDAIRADLDSKRFNYSVVCCNIGNDFNIATIIRNANAFLAKEVVIYGHKKYDRRGTVGTHHYTNFHHVRDIDSLSNFFVNVTNECVQSGQRIRIVGIDNVPDSKDVNAYEFDPGTHYVMVFGQEQIGIPADVLSMCDDILYIPQYGSVRSINVGTASGIIMNNYCSKIHSFVV